MNTLLKMLLLMLCCSQTVLAFESGIAGFGLSVNGSRVPFNIFSISLMPGETAELKLDHAATVSASGGKLEGSEKRWRWRAPASSGHHTLRINSKGSTISVNVFVLRPASNIKNGFLGEYRMGEYQSQPLKGLASYQKPRGFIAVSKEMAELQVSPHFTLGEFLCKQASGWPKYLILGEKLLVKLELTLQLFEKNGIDTSGVVVMSGYRTPWYNQSIGNSTKYSRHLYGGAADIYIDSAPRDGIMDDVNKDGKRDQNDAKYLYHLVDGWLSEDQDTADLRGGLSHYRANAAHGPFLHIDTRGHRARW